MAAMYGMSHLDRITAMSCGLGCFALEKLNQEESHGVCTDAAANITSI